MNWITVQWFKKLRTICFMNELKIPLLYNCYNCVSIKLSKKKTAFQERHGYAHHMETTTVRVHVSFVSSALPTPDCDKRLHHNHFVMNKKWKRNLIIIVSCLCFAKERHVHQLKREAKKNSWKLNVTFFILISSLVIFVDLTKETTRTTCILTFSDDRQRAEKKLSCLFSSRASLRSDLVGVN